MTAASGTGPGSARRSAPPGAVPAAQLPGRVPGADCVCHDPAPHQLSGPPLSSRERRWAGRLDANPGPRLPARDLVAEDDLVARG